MDDKLAKIMEVTNALRSEKDINVLLDLILVRAMEIVNCEAGTMYLANGNHLFFQVIRNNKLPELNRNRSSCILPPVPIRKEYLCARALLEQKTIVVRDIYDDKDAEDQLKGPFEYDAKSGYSTRSMMVIPLVSRTGERLGVLQLINAVDADGEYTGFLPEHEFLIGLFADQTTIALEQAKLQAQLKGMEWIIGQTKRKAISDVVLKDLYQYIEKHYCSEINLESISDELGGEGPKLKSSSREIRDQLTRETSLQKISSALAEQTRESARQKLYDYVVESGRRDSEIARAAGLSRSSFYHALNGNRTITKNYMYSIAVALELSTESLEELLMLNGYCFQPDNKRDLAIRYLFEENDRYEKGSKLNLSDFNIILDEIGVEVLGEKVR